MTPKTETAALIARPETLYKRSLQPLALFDRTLLVPAIGGAFKKLDPRTLVKNPVMFVVEIVSVLTTYFFIRDLVMGAGTVVGTNALFSGQMDAIRPGSGENPRG